MANDLTMAERIKSRVTIVNAGFTSPCWLSDRASNGKGYTKIGLLVDGRKVTRYTHRVSYETFVGPIPAGLTLDHLCRNRGCCNPAHLEPTTIGVNTLRGESMAALHARQTHCLRGHEFTPENTHLQRGRHGTQRNCRTCRRDRARGLRAA